LAKRRAQIQIVDSHETVQLQGNTEVTVELL